MSVKPLGIKAYGHIPHLPTSRIGPGDHRIGEGQTRICTEKSRPGDEIILQEKADGSAVAVAKIEGVITPLGKAGYPSLTSPFKQHHLFAAWVFERAMKFEDILSEGERIVGEWLAQAHGTRYFPLLIGPFMAFDLMRGHDRMIYDHFMKRVGGVFPTPRLLHRGGPISIEKAQLLLEPSGYGKNLDPVEGAVWRVEYKEKVDFLAKWVRPDKEDGKYLDKGIWNWLPKRDIMDLINVNLNEIAEIDKTALFCNRDDDPMKFLRRSAKARIEDLTVMLPNREKEEVMAKLRDMLPGR